MDRMEVVMNQYTNALLLSLFRSGFRQCAECCRAGWFRHAYAPQQVKQKQLAASEL